LEIGNRQYIPHLPRLAQLVADCYLDFCTLKIEK
jgi:hypothetical protein